MTALTNLSSLTNLYNCRKGGQLPPLGLLPSLTRVDVRGMASIKQVGAEFYGNEAMIELSKGLVFQNCKNSRNAELGNLGDESGARTWDAIDSSST